MNKSGKFDEIIIFSALFLISLFSKPAYSHPHGWIETRVDFLLENGNITAVQTRWEFDEFTSMAFIHAIDFDGDKKLNIPELLKTEDYILKVIRRASYFSNVYIDNIKQPVNEIKFVNASLNNDLIQFSFVIPLLKPVIPHKNKLAVSFYDPEYYYDVYIAEENPVKFISDKSGIYSYKIEDDLKNTYYFNMVDPQIIRVFCK